MIKDPLQGVTRLLCSTQWKWEGGGGRIRSGDISLDIRTSDIGGLRQRTFAALATNTKEQAKSLQTPIIQR